MADDEYNEEDAYKCTMCGRIDSETINGHDLCFNCTNIEESRERRDRPLAISTERKRVMGHLETGIYVRAQDERGKWGSFDIMYLTSDSLLAWLRSRGGRNRLAENVVGIMFGHEHLHEPEGPDQ